MAEREPFADSEGDGGEFGTEPVRSAELAAAYALERVQDDPTVRKHAAAFLRKQSQLVDFQRKALAEEHPLRLEQLRDQVRDLTLKAFSQRLRIAFMLLLVLIAALFGIGAVILIYDAVTSQQVIVEAFNTPPALQPRGIDGRTVAGGVLDELSRIQAATRSAAQKRHLENAWTNDIKIEVPETGVSIGEISRLLHEKLGKDIHIEGDLTQPADGGLQLTVRGQGVMPSTFTAGTDDLPKLTRAAAEYIYGQAEPALYARYLTIQERYADATQFVQGMFAGSRPEDRVDLLNAWGNALGNRGKGGEALMRYREAVQLDPHFWIGYNNIMQTLWAFGREEQAWRVGQQMLRVAGGRPGKASELYYSDPDLFTWNLVPWRNSTLRDMELTGGSGSALALAGPSLADISVRLHEPAQAEFYLATSTRSEAAPDLDALTHFARGYLAIERRDGVAASREMEAFAKGYENIAVRFNYPGYGCWIAPAEELAGNRAKADAALAAGGTFVDCYRFRGDILDGRGAWAGAQKAYAAAVALAPDLPAGHYSWGLALVRHGDAMGAQQHFAEAARLGRGWADPLKAWGDLLAANGRWRSALAKYDAALKRAPGWAELRRSRALAAARSGSS
jgi:tetratricopeptide (TPR) repeat protein